MDCVNFDIMRRLGLRDVFAFGPYLAQQGFRCLPGGETTGRARTVLERENNHSIRREMGTVQDYLAEFENAEVVHDFFGRWPSLHDAEVIELVLNRELGFDFTGPRLTMTLYGCADCSAAEPQVPKHCKLIVMFEDVELAYLRDFNHQNAMADFMMETYHCDRLREDRYRVEFGEFGAKMDFTFKTARVLSISPFEPIDYFKKQESSE
ncbi:MAG: hypothetical protein A3K19_24715 [Lentisphaerae bacterium RIFOXYB12_FULL_65_16]|nr:MAG: hypothetical protein A3K18_24130 [Lentisphaerae bacterium RIFOXYA12_64_32]OGV90674.1 MAG: hypothetical protein A3K19_24715 [Lentisphaerae bacterium RIFOXYB12_FULL_65_16]